MGPESEVLLHVAISCCEAFHGGHVGSADVYLYRSQNPLLDEYKLTALSSCKQRSHTL